MRLISKGKNADGTEDLGIEFETEEEFLQLNRQSKAWKANNKGNLSDYKRFIPAGVNKRSAEARRAMFIGAALMAEQARREAQESEPSKE